MNGFGGLRRIAFRITNDDSESGFFRKAPCPGVRETLVRVAGESRRFFVFAEEIGRQQYSAETLLTERGKITRKRKYDPDRSVRALGIGSWLPFEVAKARQFGVRLGGLPKQHESLGKESQPSTIQLVTYQRLCSIDPIRREIELTGIERAPAQLEQDCGRRCSPTQRLQHGFEFGRRGRGDQPCQFPIDGLSPGFEPPSRRGIAFALVGFLAEFGRQQAQLLSPFDRRLRERDTQAKRRALLGKRKSRKIEWVEQPPSRLLTIASIFELCQSESSRCRAIGSRITTQDLAQPAHALLLPTIGEGELRELFRGVVRELTAWVASDEGLESRLGGSRVRRQVAHRAVVGGPLLGWYLWRAGGQKGTTQLQHTEKDADRDPPRELTAAIRTNAPQSDRKNSVRSHDTPTHASEHRRKGVYCDRGRRGTSIADYTDSAESDPLAR